MIVVRTVAELRGAVALARGRGECVGLVPTMGSFHEGHLTLMRRARVRCGMVVVSLFVNPTQFNDAGDLARYPRDEARDSELASSAGVHVLFAPSVEEVYPAGFSSTVEVHGLAAPLEGVVRGSDHFRGVATVVAKLFNMAQPDDAYFGQKDAQQALLVRRMVRDLNLPVRIEVCPTVREDDGLAMSSRNVLLSADDRRRAPALARALFAVADAVAAGERAAPRALGAGAAILAAEGIVPEYFAAVSTDTLAPVATIEAETLIALAARLGKVRLIDNVLVSPVGRAR
ncbi:MAG TPA: pantoate--beta-alanine ligase [Gemmatimonadaceae bacterium]|nr:pantoate--beta-alanine ligase [Gemmatimonadaceae bacterium]